VPQSLSSILVHLVYSTKNRQPFITPEIEPELHAYQATIFRALECPSLEINGTSDHVHALFRLARTIALCDVAEEVKKRSSKWLKTKGRQFASFQWQAGYGAFSIGESGVTALRRYIQRQKEHHRRKSFQDEYRSLLAKYGVKYDERYVWD
jgi:REP element-mobilizing transposase RayT